MVLNKSSKDVWAYQAAVGTAAIVAIDSVSYWFGGKYNEECGKWRSPFVENRAEPHWVYNSGTPTLTDLESQYPTFSHVFLPVSAQCYAWMQGLPEDADPNVNISTLTSGMTYPLTIRLEELGGTHPDVTQAVDCYCIVLTSIAQRDKEFMVEAEFVYGALEDIDPAGDNRPILTTAPLAPGLMTGEYNGNPILKWNNVSIPGFERAQWRETKEHSVVSDGDDTQTIHTGKSQPVEILLHGGIEIDDMWDDYKARTTRNMTIQVKKYDDTSNIMFTFTNCKVISYERIGQRYKGKYATTCTLEAEKVTAASDWFTEYGEGAGAAFDTHWKAKI